MIQVRAKGLVWDFDGTLLNSYKIQKDTLTELFRELSIEVPTDDEFLHHYHGHLRDSIRGLSNLEGEELERLYETFILTEEHHYEQPKALYFNDALGLIRRAASAGLKQIIVSNRPHFRDTRLGSPRNLAKRQPLAEYINAVVCGDDNEFHKPDARVLDEVEKRLGLERTELLVIGDQFVDVEFAQNLHCQAVLVLRTDEKLAHEDKLHADWRDHTTIVRSLEEISVKPLAERIR